MNLYKHLIIPGLVLFCALALCAAESFADEEVMGPSEVEMAGHSIMGAKDPNSMPEGEFVKNETEPARILTLEECLNIAIKNHLPLKTVKKSVKLAQWRLFEARRNLLPKVGVRMEEHSGQIGGRRFYGKSTAVDLQQTAFHGGEFMYTMMQAQTNLKIVNKEYSRIKNDLILQVKKGYYTLAKAKENFKSQEDLSRETSRIREMVIKQFESGVGSSLEFLNVSSQTNQIRFQFVSAKGDVEVAELILKQAMSIDSGARIDIEPPNELKKVNIDFEKVLRDALVHRPEMQINSMMMQYYIYEKKIANSKSWPKIDFIGSFGMAKEEYIAKDMGIDPATGTVDPDQKMLQQWYAGVKCSIPLWGSTGEYSYTKEVWTPVVSAFRGTSTITNSYKFNFLDNLAQYSEKYSADVDMDRARQELIKIKQDITLEVKEVCFNYEKALLQLDTAVNKVKYQEGDLELVKFRRQMDEAQDSNVIESMIKLAQERFGYVQALSDCQVAIASISKAVGAPEYFKDIEPTNGNNGNNK
ncbi:MAG: TolC family protein [Candidatus Omnitrophota bacterium]|nr:TolC family protein [Candidatus Omnitrophota bacterium]